MARRLEVELTSTRDDGTWTWRAAGAKQPKGELDGSLLYGGAKVGDVCKVEAEFHLDGIEVLETFAPKTKDDRSAGLLELISTPVPDSELVTEVKAKGGRGGGNRDRDRDRGRGPKRDRKPRAESEGSGRKGGPRRERPAQKPREDERPRPKRLRPKNLHRKAVMDAVPEAQRPIADQLLAGGMPAVRTAIEKQNSQAPEGTPKVPSGPILKIAEDLMPKLRTAEWRDRADAALADLDELDLRDLRSVVVAADAGARDDETRALAETLKEALAVRIEADHGAWMADLTKAVSEERTVRALRLSSRPVKAGSPLPADMAKTLAEQASAALGADVAADRWATVLDAVAYSPLRNAITPSGYPAETNDEFMDAVRSVADRVPLIAGHYGIDPKEAAAAKKRRHAANKARAKSGGQGNRSRGKSRSEGERSERSERSDRPKRSSGSRDGDSRGPRRGRDDKPKAKKRSKNEPLEPGKAAQEARRLAAEAEAKAAEAAAAAAAAEAAAPEDETPKDESAQSDSTTEAPVEESSETPAEDTASAEDPAEAADSSEDSETPEAEET